MIPKQARSIDRCIESSVFVAVNLTLPLVESILAWTPLDYCGIAIFKNNFVHGLRAKPAYGVYHVSLPAFLLIRPLQ